LGKEKKKEGIEKKKAGMKFLLVLNSRDETKKQKEVQATKKR